MLNAILSYIATIMLICGSICGIILEIGSTYYSGSPPTKNNFYRVMLYIVLFMFGVILWISTTSYVDMPFTQPSV